MADIVTNTNATGTATGDIIINSGGGYSTISGGDGNDAIVLDHGPVFTDAGAGNNSVASAQSIDFAANWTTGNNPLVADDTIPYTTILGTGANATDFFAVTIGAGETITLDIDFGSGVGASMDTMLQLFDSAGIAIPGVFNDDSSTGSGGQGSASGFDSFLTYTNAGAAATFYIQVSQFAGFSNITAGNDYLLNVSVSGHAATGSVVVSGDGAYGEGGNDHIVGGSGSDYLSGGAGDDRLFGNGGADTLQAGVGNDVVDGGSGTDRVDYGDAAAGVVVDLSNTAAQNTVGGGTDTLLNIEDIYGSGFADTLTGNAGNNVMWGGGGAGDDVLNGLDGNDYVYVGASQGNDTADGGGGTGDTLDFYTSGGFTINVQAGTATNGVNTVTFSNFENIYGTSGADTITSATGVFIDARGGDDYVYAILGTPETISGGSGFDWIDTSLYNSLNVPYAINMTTGVTSDGESYTNFENLYSGATADSIVGTTGDNQIYTNDGDDTIEALGGSNIVVAGTGFDFASYASAGTGVNVSLLLQGGYQATNISSDYLSGVEGLIGSGFADALTGDANANTFIGGGGADIVNGGDGNDVFVWNNGDGSDTLNGGNDSDTLDLRNSTFGWTVSLGTNAGSNTNGDTVTLSGIERILGTGVNDTFTSWAGAFIDAGGGDDLVFASNFANETLDGGSGVDTLDTTSFNSLNSPYVVNLVTGLTNYAGETYLNFENVVTGATADTITGTAGANIITTNAGNDIINAGGDADDVDAGDGADSLYGEAGNDDLEGGAGDDYIDGGADFDVAYYSTATAGVVVNLALAGSQNTVGAGNDTLVDIQGLSGSGFNDTLRGSNANNSLAGRLGNDTLYGEAGNDVMNGNEGNDTLLGGAGDDSIAGGDGFDVASYAAAASAVTVSLSAVGSQNTIGDGFDVLGQIEGLIGSAFDDSLIGNTSNNLLNGGLGNDSLNAGFGNDNLVGDVGNDTLYGGAGDDSLNGGVGFDTASYANSGVGVTVNLSLAAAQVTGLGTDTLTGIEAVAGSAFNDTLTGNAGGNLLNAGAGNDTLNGGGGNDTLQGHAGNDVIDGGAGVDVTQYASAGSGVTVNLSIVAAQNTGGGGIDTITNVESIDGSGHGDTLTGNSGDNIINGLGGNDLISGGLGNDTLIGGAGIDFVTYASAAAGVSVNLLIVGGQNTVGAGTDSLSGVESLIGSAFADTLRGNGGANTLQGGNGGDTLVGNDGADALYGGLGNDLINMGNGADRIYFDSTLGAGNVDTLVGFVAADDTIYLENAVFTGLAGGPLAGGAYNTGAAATEVNDRIIYNSATGALLFDADGLGGAAGIQFATLSAGLVLSEADFSVI